MNIKHLGLVEAGFALVMLVQVAIITYAQIKASIFIEQVNRSIPPAQRFGSAGNCPIYRMCDVSDSGTAIQEMISAHQPSIMIMGLFRD